MRTAKQVRAKHVNIVVFMVILLLCSSIFSFAQETDSGSGTETNTETVTAVDDANNAEPCGFGCKMWQFLFGSKEARSGRAWFDRDEALVGEAAVVLEEVVVVDVPVWTKETDDQFKKPGTVYKNINEEYFITNSKGVGEKITASAALSRLTENNVKSQLQQSLGASYQQFEKSLGKVKSFSDRPEAGVLVISGSGGEIVVDKQAEDGLHTAKYLGKDNKVVESYIIKDGQILATQTADGKVKVGETSYDFPKDKVLTESINDLTKGIQLPGKEGPSGLLKLEGNVFTAVDYEKETLQQTNTKSGEKENLNIDYYKEGSSGCKLKSGCFVEIGGEATIINAKGEAQRYLVDYDYEGTGAERKQKAYEKKYFNPLNGNQDGARYKDGTKIITLKEGDGKYTGEYSFTTSDGTTTTVKKVGETWQPTGNQVADAAADYAAAKEDASSVLREVDEEILLTTPDSQLSPAQVAAKTQLEATKATLEEATVDQAIVADQINKEENKMRLEAIESSSRGDLATARAAIQSIYAITNNLKSYPAISNLLFGDTDFFKNWRAQQDAAFAPLLGENIWNSVICEVGFNHWQDLEQEGKAILKTPSGTYQMVASIQMERSPETSPILCHKNPDEESDDLFICDLEQVCIDENFCYADKDRDYEPDSKDPLKGYFYKVTWAVSAPQDEAFTPLVDENGVAVSFNIFLYPGPVPMYNLNGNIASPIQLQNGDRDKDAIIKYSTQLFDRACIVWNQAPLTAGSAGGVLGGALTFGAAEAREPIGSVCFDRYDDEGEEIDGFISNIGQVNWERSGQEATSVTVSHGEVNRNTDW